MARLAGGLPRRHPVQGDGDGPYLILGQHQAEQGGKLVQLHGPLPQQGGALLQAAAQDVPQLAIFLRQQGFPPALQLLHPLGKALRQADLLQKCVKGYRLTAPGFIGVAAQRLQRLGHSPPGGVQPVHQSAVRLLPGETIAPGMPGPGLVLGPGAPPDVPLQHIVFQQVPVLLGQVRKPRFQIAEHVVIGIVPRHRVQGRRHQGQHGLFQDVRHGGGEHRDAEPGENALDQVPIGPIVPGHHADIPKAQALVPGQAQGAGGGPLHLRPGAGGPEQLHCPGLGDGLDLLVAEEGVL